MMVDLDRFCCIRLNYPCAPFNKFLLLIEKNETWNKQTRVIYTYKLLYFSFFKSNNNVLDRLDNKKYYSTNLPLQETTLKKNTNNNNNKPKKKYRTKYKCQQTKPKQMTIIKEFNLFHPQ
jgi:hypothetical protein